MNWSTNIKYKPFKNVCTFHISRRLGLVTSLRSEAFKKYWFIPYASSRDWWSKKISNNICTFYMPRWLVSSSELLNNLPAFHMPFYALCIAHIPYATIVLWKEKTCIIFGKKINDTVAWWQENKILACGTYVSTI